MVFSGVLLCWSAGIMAADDYPIRPITLVSGYAPGGSSDAVARVLADALGKELGQQVVVMNRPGAGTTIAATSVARAPADGYTLYLGSASLYGGDKALYPNITYEPEDFIAITKVSYSPLLLSVNRGTGIESVADLIKRAKAEPGKLAYSSAGTGSIIHMGAVLFSREADIDMLHVPYKGGGPSVVALAAGEVSLSFSTAASVAPMIETGKVVGLAVTTAERFPLLPQYPTVSESGVPGYSLTNWYGVFAPAKTPDAIIERLFDATTKVLRDPVISEQLAKMGEVADPSSNMVEFEAFALEEGKTSAQLATQTNAGKD